MQLKVVEPFTSQSKKLQHEAFIPLGRSRSKIVHQKKKSPLWVGFFPYDINQNIKFKLTRSKKFPRTFLEEETNYVWKLEKGDTLVPKGGPSPPSELQKLFIFR